MLCDTKNERINISQKKKKKISDYHSDKKNSFQGDDNFIYR